jgi:hypothetical protein
MKFRNLATRASVFAALLLAPVAFAHEGHAHVADKAAVTAATVNAKQAATRAVLRDLWVEHVFWIRNYVTASAAHDAKQQAVAADQVVANAKAISGAVGSFYGQPAGDRMLALLAGHWGAVKDYSDATFVSKDAKAQQAATMRLIDNAKAIAAFLAKANPNLPEATLVGLLSAHGAHHIAQIQQLANGDYAGEAKTWAAMRAHMFTIADALGDALARQFPERF